ncbi:hypothetical protein D3C76_1456220 [compost metagenome]
MNDIEAVAGREGIGDKDVRSGDDRDRHRLIAAVEDRLQRLAPPAISGPGINRHQRWLCPADQHIGCRLVIAEGHGGDIVLIADPKPPGFGETRRETANVLVGDGIKRAVAADGGGIAHRFVVGERQRDRGRRQCERVE